jgi:hypothetical protein
MQVRNWTDDPPEPTPVRPPKAHPGKGWVRYEQSAPAASRQWTADGAWQTASVVAPNTGARDARTSAPRHSATRTVSPWPWFGLLCTVLFVVLLLSHRSPSRNTPEFDISRIVQESGLSVLVICGYRGGPIVALTETADYSSFATYQATCGDDPSSAVTPNFTVSQ